MASFSLVNTSLMAFLVLIGYSQALYAESDMVIDSSQTSCLLEPSMDVELSSAVQGVVRQMNVRRGDSVKKNQIVMKLNSSVEQAMLDTASARLEFAKREVKRNADLYHKNLISESEQDEMLTEQNLAEFQVKEAKVRLRQRETRSPLSGVVVKRLKQPGEYVDETPFLRVVSLNPLHAEVFIQADLYGEISKNSTITLYTDSSETGYAGEIKLIDPIIDAASNTFAITVELDNKKGQLVAGTRCRVEFTKTTSDH